MSVKFKVALVGHCGPDSFALQSSVMGFVPNSEIVKINSKADRDAQLGELSLLLVNRVLDGTFESESGIELIRGLRDDGPKMMLITNFPEYIEESIEAGAVKGYGKQRMRAPETEAPLHQALGIS